MSSKLSADGSPRRPHSPPPFLLYTAVPQPYGRCATRTRNSGLPRVQLLSRRSDPFLRFVLLTPRWAAQILHSRRASSRPRDAPRSSYLTPAHHDASHQPQPLASAFLHRSPRHAPARARTVPLGAPRLVLWLGTFFPKRMIFTIEQEDDSLPPDATALVKQRTPSPGRAPPLEPEEPIRQQLNIAPVRFPLPSRILTFIYHLYPPDRSARHLNACWPSS